MTTTYDALCAGSTSYVLVAAIEGWSELFTNGDTTAVATAWAGTDWSTVKGGLFVEMSVDQKLDPDQPFGRMGTCNLTMTPQGNGTDDVFGVAIGRKTSTAETYLDATMDNTTATVTVKSTANFASSGYVHIGTECIAYTGKTASTFTTLTRGMFSPFGDRLTYTTTRRQFTHQHRVTQDQNSVKLTPVVSATPRTWAGRWVGVWAHRVVGGVLDTKAQAALLWAGRLDDWQDSANDGSVTISVTGASEVMGDRVIGQSQWEGEAKDGVYISAGQVFRFTDGGSSTSSITTKTANNLTCVSTAAANVNQIKEGYWTLTNLCAVLTSWLVSESAASRINGSYTISSPVAVGNSSLRTRIFWTFNPGVNASIVFILSSPVAVSLLLGVPDGTLDPGASLNTQWSYSGAAASGSTLDSPAAPNRFVTSTTGTLMSRGKFVTRTGTVTDQYATLPSQAKANTTATGQWGLFQFGDDKRIELAQITDNGDGTIDLSLIQPGLYDGDADFGTAYGMLSLSAESEGTLVVRQIYAFESTLSALVTTMATSTGTASYNIPAAYSTHPFGCGCEMPYELVQSLEASLNRIPGGTGPIAVVVERPTKFSDLLRSDLMFRWSYLYWRGTGDVQAGAWRSPTATLNNGTFDETNKAEPSGHKTTQKTTTTETTEWLRPIVKVRYNRNAGDASSDAYQSSIIFEDRVAVDDAGGAVNTVTISLRNTYKDFAATGQSVRQLLPVYLTLMPLVSRPARKAARTMNSTCFLSTGLGDIMLFTDTHARDPETGLRGITDRPTIVVRHKYSFGGELAGSEKSADSGGEVELFFTDQNPDRSSPSYCPSADVYETINIAGFSAGYSASTVELAVYEHRYSHSTELQDCTSFAAGDKVLIIERDPLDPDNPTKWERTVSAVTTGGFVNGITLTATLSSPAWDATKRYHVLSQDYATATTTQRVNAYMADDVDGMIVDTSQPFLYGAGAADLVYANNSSTEIELPPSSRYADGAGRDVAHESAICRLLDNIIDYTSCAQAPFLTAVELSNTTNNGYQMVAYYPEFLSFEIGSNAVYRYLTIAPWARSTDGTSTSIRVTVSRDRPSFSSVNNAAWAGTYAQAEWTGITSTTATTLADRSTINANVKNQFGGMCWVTIECQYKCATRGLAKFVEGTRQYITYGT